MIEFKKKGTEWRQLERGINKAGELGKDHGKIFHLPKNRKPLTMGEDNYQIMFLKRLWL